MQIHVKRSKDDKNPVKVEYDFGADLQEAHAKFDGDGPLDKVVYGLFVQAARQQLQDYVRKLLEPLKSKAVGKPGKAGYKPAKVIREAVAPDKIQELVDGWKPAVERQAKRSVRKAEKVISSLTPEERAELFRTILGEEDEEVEGLVPQDASGVDEAEDEKYNRDARGAKGELN